MITASEAKKLSVIGEEKHLKATLEKLGGKIKKAAEKGYSRLKTNLSKKEVDISVPILEQSGYTVKTDKLFSNLFEVTVSW